MVEWSNGHSAITERQKRYAEQHCFGDVILSSRGVCYCTHCKTSWKSSANGKAVCPHCGKQLDVVEHKRKYTMVAYFMVFTTVNKMQVAKWYQVRRFVKFGDLADTYDFRHVGTEFLTDKGRRYSVELPRCPMCWERDRWSFYGDQELRKYNVFSRYLYAQATYYERIMPIFKRNGFKTDRQFEGEEMNIMQQLLCNPSFESWLKIGHWGVVLDWLRLANVYEYSCHHSQTKPKFSEAQRTAIKLANRNHIVFDTKEKWLDFNDYLKDLIILGKDIHNPSILFPKDFQEAHRKAYEKVTRIRERERARQENERMVRTVLHDQNKVKWLDEYAAKFSDMMLENGEFTVKPLINISDFNAEAEHMHHCIRTYYGKINTLLLSIEHCGKKCETAEVYLVGRGSIIQCRGVGNKPSEYHDTIVEMLEGFMKEFLRRYTTDNKQCNLPVLANFYKQYQIAI